MLTFPEIRATEGIHSELQNLGFPAVLKYLRDRGIHEGMIDDLGLHIMPAAEVIRRSRGSASADDRLAVVFPHYNVGGDYINWWSSRLVDCGLRPVVASFASLVPHKRGKMYCPPNEPPHAYLPPILDWRLLQKGDRVYIHESCIKAINGARLGHWSIGLNGVWGWGSRKHNLSLVQELRDLPWRALQLRPVIVFDSNASDNWDVQAAISQLTARLLEITGQHATHILLPKHGDEHRGFDDFCVQEGDDAARAFLDQDGTVVEISGVAMLKTRLSSEVCVVRSLGRIAEQATCTLMTRGTFTDVNFAHYVAEVEDSWVNVPKLWLADPRRVEVESITYAPGKDRIFEGKLNSWKGMGIEPEAGDVSMWLGQIEKNVPDPALRDFLLCWLAYPLQHPGSKLHSFVHLFGPPGSGKQAVFGPLKHIYGDNATIVGQPQIISSFNSIYANKQFINFDEIHSGQGGDADVVINKLKMLTTGDDMVVNTKGQPEYKVPNVAQIGITTNYSDAVKYDDDDRRGFVLKYGVRGKGEGPEFWTQFWEEWLPNGGAAAVYHYLLSYDTSKFNPKGWAPVTEEKADVTRSTRRVDEQWVMALCEEPDDVLPPILKGRCLMTTAELAQYCYGEDPTGITPNKRNALGIKLNSAGMKKVDMKVDGQKVRFWVIRRVDEDWDAERARKHLKAFKYPGIK